MGKHTVIAWTNHTFNPWWGCTRVSPACTSCYAATWARRVGQDIWGDNKARRFFGEKHWREPLEWNSSALERGARERVFCASMGDVFEARDDLVEHRIRLWKLIKETPSLDWLLLTKRVENVAAMVPWKRRWPTNIWLGTTIEDQEMADLRMPQLVRLPARVRFVSCEPLLGEVTLKRWLNRTNWVIVGGETGAKARPMEIAWARSLRDECKKANTPFFFKQWGKWAPDKDDMLRSSQKNIHNRNIDGEQWNEFPRQ